MDAAWSADAVRDVVYNFANCAASNVIVSRRHQPTVPKLCVTAARPGKVDPKKMPVISMACGSEFVDSRVPI